jgi:hypothetical protein
MKYTLSKDRARKFIEKRPSLINAIEGLTEKLVLGLFRNHDLTEDIYEKLPVELRTLEVSRLYLKQMEKNRWGFNFELIPVEVVKQFTAVDRALVLTKGTDECRLALPDVTSAEWCTVFKVDGRSFSAFEEIPKDSWTREMIIALLESGFSGCSGYSNEGKSPDRILADAVDHLFDQDFALEVAGKQNSLYLIPKRFLTSEIMKRALSVICSSGSQFNLDNMSTEGDIPETAWTPDVADLAMTVGSHNYQHIPERLLTSAHRVKAAGDGYFEKEWADDYQALITFLSDHRIRDNCKEKIQKVIKSQGLRVMMDALKIEGCDVKRLFNNLQECNVHPDMNAFIEAVRINPEFIKIIPKPEQTNELIDALITSASAEKVDELADWIDLRRIRSTNALVLIGCKHHAIVRVVESIMKGQRYERTGTRQAEDEPAAAGSVVIKMSPGDFESISARISDD